MKNDTAVRTLLARALAWEDAHVSFEKAVEGIPPASRGEGPAGLPYSPWQLVEHLRLTQHDILEFCRNADYREPNWPSAYWPPSAAPPSAAAWDESIRTFLVDRRALQDLASDPSIALDAEIPHGTGQTYMRELVLVVDHSAYHVGQLVLVRRLLGVWSS